MQVGQSEQVRSSLARLNVFEGHIINLLPAGEGVVDIAEHLGAGRANVDFRGRNTQGGHQAPRIAKRQLASRKARHRVCEDVFARQSQAVHSFGGDDEGVGGVQAPGYADNCALCAHARKPLKQAVDLDVVGLEPALVPLVRITGHIRKSRNRSF